MTKTQTSWVNEELKVTGKKNHKTDRGRADDMVKMHKPIQEGLKVDFE